MFSASAAALHLEMDDDCLSGSRHDMGMSSSNNGHSSTSLSKAELRKNNKPIMEKKRRARINHCLNELKSLILDAMKKDPARHSKLEKADILEMTVKHLQSVQRQQLTVAVATDPGVLQKFKTGFSECASEVGRYVSRLDGVEPSVRQRLSNHLNQCVNGLQQIAPTTTSPLSFPGPSSGVVLATPTAVQGTPNASPQMPFPAGDVNNNNTTRNNSVQLIPSRLPSGELAFVLPSSAGATPPYFPAPASRPSAFTAVQRAPSPQRPSNATSPSSSDSDESCSSYPHSASPSPPQQQMVVKPTALTIELKTMSMAASGSDFRAAKGVLDFSMKPPPAPKRHVEVLGDASNSKVPRMAFAGVNFAANRLMEAENAPRHPSGHLGPAGGQHDSMWRPW